MTNSRFVLATAIAATLLAIAAGPAGAVEIGSRCTLGSDDKGTFVQEAEATGGPTYISPISGVVTQWGTTLPAPAAFPMRLKLLTYGATTGYWKVVGESSFENPVTGTNTFATRLPILAGTRIGVNSDGSAGTCISGIDPGEIASFDKGVGAVDHAVGTEFDPHSSSNVRLALFAVIEPDADGDGFGDESQDLCPQRADLQSACPVVSIGKVTRKAAKKSLKLSFSTGGQSSVKLAGSARVPAHGGRRAKTIRFKALSKQSSATGAAVLTVKYPKSLRSALGRLPKGKKIKLTFKLSATGLINTATKTVRASLRGRA